MSHNLGNTVYKLTLNQCHCLMDKKKCHGFLNYVLSVNDANNSFVW